MRTFLLTVLSLALLSCSGSKVYYSEEEVEKKTESPPESELLYQMFLIGDAGGANLTTQEPTLKLFEQFLESASEKSAAIFLGDNIYSSGMPDSAHPERAKAEAKMNEQLNTVKNFKGRVVVIPGNHDWDDGGKDGLNSILRQEKYVEEYLDRGNTFIPDNGFPGPVDIELMDDDEDSRLRDDIRLIVLDTQWWLHQHKKSYGDTGEYELVDGGDFLVELEDILKKRQKDFLVVAAHHPLITNGPHGGYMPPSTHLKPPVLGSLYAFYRKAFGFEQDIPHFKYKEMASTLQKMFRLNDHLVYASGHSHNLQYHKTDGPREVQHYVVSGAGTKENYVAKGRGAEFSYEGKGFTTLNYYGDGSVWLEAWAPVGDGSKGRLLHKTQLKPPYDDPLLNENESTLPDIDYTDSTIVAAPNKAYDDKGNFFRAVAGNHNRELWSIKSEYPYFDVTEVRGGLIPVRMGGKGQSNTLHLEDKEGNEFVLRSVDKQAGKVWDEDLKKTLALDLAQDQFSILNPYGALAIPPLADAVGVYHTNPKIYYVPNDPQLGLYAEQIGGQLALFEEKPDNDMSSVASVGFSEEVVAYRDMIREVDNDIDHRVDQEMFARARLLDMIIGDWDRHSDQWRWATFEPDDEQGKIYRPIPRDRDVAFMKMDGIIPTLAKYGPFFQYQNFGGSYNSLVGLNYNSLAQTRRFTNQLTKEEWLAIAEKMQDELTDEVIVDAINQMPEEVQNEIGEFMTRALQSRRENLVQVTEKYYTMLSGVVSVPASNKRERFVVEVLDDQQTIVQVYKLSGEGNLREKYFERTFKKNETKEVRLYGLGGDDEFIFNGEQKSSIKLLISGGPGDDEYIDYSPDQVVSKKLVGIFETKTGNDYEVSGKTHLHLTDNPIENYYDYQKDFIWNRYYPGYFFNYNNDEGIFIGGGPKILRNGFRKFPAVTHYLRVNYAPQSGAANIRYSGKWFDRVGKWDLGMESAFLFPKSYRNFFGLGNETSLDDRGSKFYRARLTRVMMEPSLTQNINQSLSVTIGNRLSITEVDENPDEPNVVNEAGLGFDEGAFKDQWYNTLFFKTVLSDIDNKSNPTQGYELSISTDANIGLRNTSRPFTRLKTELEMYFPISFTPQVTFANRVGGVRNIGPFPFYESNSIGGRTNLRGFRGNRFSGRSSFYNNTEVRIELFDFYRYLLGGKLGVTAFYDTGRVWVNSESSDIWHKGYGGGLWFNAFDAFILNSTVGHSVEGYFFEFKAGFFF
ncbi:MAG: BamA/TamA family outer membrane protein [Balneolaceae bacterium]|nr:BamA/TamA family outer membrane protein [Balneolaceae bacterium]MBO6545629.1 BamA/TamA family outer membrane protein [Balneolaceae bacterium]MBO6647025.1 BamA/TamA family outer membrane protein [Balneolaceae bacterium]